MKEILINVPGEAYKIIIQRGGLQLAGSLIKEVISSQQIFLISNPTVYTLYGNTVEQSLQRVGFKVITGLMPDGEPYKNMNEVLRLIDQAIDQELERTSAVVALGGGVVGDLSGFVAAIYQRGIDFVQIPTTLLSMVDSSIGGKVGVNHPQAKNMIGAFHQPKLVLIDPQTLGTLPEEEFLSGLGEIQKYGVIYDCEFFGYLEDHVQDILEKDPDVIETIIERSCQNKGIIVSNDEKEKGLRIILNLGHTFGHAIESLGHFQKYKHGQGVAIGTIMAAYLSCEMGWLNEEQRGRIENLILQMRLHCAVNDLDSADILRAMRHDKKVRDGKVNFVLPFGIGHYQVTDEIPEELILKAIEYGKIVCKSS